MGVFLLQILPHTGDGASRADAADEEVDLALQIGVQLRACGEVVGGRICLIFKLPRDPGGGQGFRQFLCLLDSALHSQGAGGEDHFPAVGFHQQDPFF